MINFFDNKKLYISNDLYVECNKVSEVIPHSHDFLELAYIINGSATHIINGKKIELKKNTYIIIDYGAKHSYDNISKDLVIFNCLFKPMLIDHSLAYSKSLAQLIGHYLINIGFEISQHQFIYNVFNDTDGAVLTLLNKILYEYEAQATGCIQIMRSILTEVIILTMRKVEMTQRIYLNHSEKEISEIISDIHKNYLNPLTLQEYSDKYNTSISSLSKKFKKQTGHTYSHYIQMKRIEQACRLLSNTNEKIIMIAYECGYTDMKHFNSIFKKIMGTTPTMYRKILCCKQH